MTLKSVTIYLCSIQPHNYGYVNKITITDGNLNQNTPPQIGKTPPPLRGHSMVVDPDTEIAYVFGGRGVDFNSSIYTLHLPTFTWSCVNSENAPTAREHHTAVVCDMLSTVEYLCSPIASQ